MAIVLFSRIVAASYFDDNSRRVEDLQQMNLILAHLAQKFYFTVLASGKWEPPSDGIDAMRLEAKSL